MHSNSFLAPAFFNLTFWFGRFLGFRGAALITIGCVSFSALLSIIAFYEVALSGSPCSIQLAPWFISEYFSSRCLCFATSVRLTFSWWIKKISFYFWMAFKSIWIRNLVFKLELLSNYILYKPFCSLFYYIPKNIYTNFSLLTFNCLLKSEIPFSLK